MDEDGDDELPPGHDVLRAPNGRGGVGAPHDRLRGPAARPPSRSSTSAPAASTAPQLGVFWRQVASSSTLRRRRTQAADQ